MSADVESDPQLEIGHVLAMDIVGYSKLLIHEQTELQQRLNEIVRSTNQFRAADADGKLIRLPTGDGMALVFFGDPKAPIECATEIATALTSHRDIQLRMGIHSGPVNEVLDVNERRNVAGAGIDIAQRVMDCGDAGHILLSKRVADDLAPYARWNAYLHDLGECEVKHGRKVSLVNFYTDEIGNPQPPQKCQQQISKPKKRYRSLTSLAVGIIVLAALAWLGFYAAETARRAVRLQTNATNRQAGGPSLPAKSIAVLPFENLSRDPDNAFFAGGVQDEILTNLARIADLKVISRTSVMQYKTGIQRNLRKIGQELGVAHVLEGSVQRAKNRVRVNAQLVDARNDAHLWAETYDRELADVFKIQSEIAKAIADQLRAKILPREKLAIETQPTKDLGAYDLYVRASEMLDTAPSSQDTKATYLEAISLLEQAITRDPSFVNAYCKLAQAHDQLYLFGGDHTLERLGLAESVLDRALRLQPDAPEVHLARAAHFYSKLDYDRARAEIEIARRTLPNNAKVFEWLGYIDRRQGRWEESTRNLERALELDPQNFLLLNQIGTSYEFLHQYSKNAVVLDRAIALRPDDIDVRISRAQLEVVWKADPRPLHTLIESAIRQNPQSSRGLARVRLFLAFAERDADGGQRALTDLRDTYGPDGVRFPRAFGEALFARLKGDRLAAEASFAKARAIQQAIVDAQPDYGPAVSVLGLVDAGLGRKEDAIREGRRAVELMPITKDSINGAHIMSHLAMIYAWVGENDLAIELLKPLVQGKGRTHYGQLRLFPQWDPLRGDPRFEELIDSLAPKDVKQ
jgi:TolB-like protein/Flp pilus assembly protein TadD